MKVRLNVPTKVYDKLDYDFSGFKNTKNILCELELSINSFKENEFRNKDYINFKYIFSFRGAKIYQKRNIRLIKYPNAICIYDFESNKLNIYSNSDESIHEVSYLFILSIIGKKLDQKGIHKLHAAAIRYKDNDIIAIGESGVGKSSLVVNLLNDNGELISDDLSIFNSKSEIIAFPLRIGLPKGSSLKDFPKAQEFERRIFGKKLILSISEYKFISNIETQKKRKFLILKKSHQSNEYKKASTYNKLKYLFKYLLIGIDTPIILEFFWDIGPVDFFKKISIFKSRLKLCINLFFKEDFYCITSTSPENQLHLVKQAIT